MTANKSSQKYQGFLKKGMRNYVNSSYNNGWRISEYNKRLVNYAKLSVCDLQLLAEKLDEHQQAQIFTTETLMPFFKALFKVNYKEGLTAEELEERRVRLLKLSYELITWIGAVSSSELAPKSKQLLQRDVPLGIRAIMMEAY